MVPDVPNTCAAIECHTDARSYRALWCAVLKDQWDLAVKPVARDREFEVLAARRWFGGRDFALVTSFAGLDPEWVNDRFRRHLAMIKARA